MFIALFDDRSEVTEGILVFGGNFAFFKNLDGGISKKSPKKEFHNFWSRPNRIAILSFITLMLSIMFYFICFAFQTRKHHHQFLSFILLRIRKEQTNVIVL